MPRPIRRVGVSGAGVTGSGIAAHFANAGVEVLLLDIVPPRLGDVRLIRTGNLEDDLEGLAGVDRVIEAIIEMLEVEQAFFAKLDDVLTPGALVASNTSGLRIADMIEGRSAAFRASVLVMRFFDPVRYMKLLSSATASAATPSCSP